MWIPTHVSSGWAPYREGHWSWVYPWGWTWVVNVYSSGSVTATSAGAGGLVGYNFQTLSNGYSNSTVSGPLYVGGAVG